jgi:hypothetical protein
MPPPRRSKPPPPLPVGYLLLGMGLLLVGFGCTVLVAGSDVDVLVRALGGTVALLSLVLVEALWYVRPWVARGVDAWAAACVGVVLLPFLGAFVVGGVGLAELLVVTFITACFVAAPCAAVRWYVRDRARKLGFLSGTATARVTVPAPRP